MLLRLGAGRFGSFEAAYELPADADVAREFFFLFLIPL